MHLSAGDLELGQGPQFPQRLQAIMSNQTYVMGAKFRFCSRTLPLFILLGKKSSLRGQLEKVVQE